MNGKNEEIPGGAVQRPGASFQSVLAYPLSLPSHPERRHDRDSSGVQTPVLGFARTGRGEDLTDERGRGRGPKLGL